MNDISNALTVSITPDRIWITFWIVVALFLIMSLILLFHWKRYRLKGDKWIPVMQTIFLVLGAVLLVAFYISTVALIAT